MREPDDGGLPGSFEDRLRGWGGRPPQIPAPAARTRVLARLPGASARTAWLRLVAAAALVVVLAVAVWRVSPRPPGEADARAGIVAQAPVDPDVVVWVLDERTTVYFVLGPKAPARGGVS